MRTAVVRIKSELYEAVRIVQRYCYAQAAIPLPRTHRTRGPLTAVEVLNYALERGLIAIRDELAIDDPALQQLPNGRSSSAR